MVSSCSDQLAQFGEESSVVFDQIVADLNENMEDTNDELDKAVYDLKDFMLKNDAELDEGLTFDIIIETRA